MRAAYHDTDPLAGTPRSPLVVVAVLNASSPRVGRVDQPDDMLPPQQLLSLPIGQPDRSGANTIVLTTSPNLRMRLMRSSSVHQGRLAYRGKTANKSTHITTITPAAPAARYNHTDWRQNHAAQRKPVVGSTIENNRATIPSSERPAEPCDPPPRPGGRKTKATKPAYAARATAMTSTTATTAARLTVPTLVSFTASSPCVGMVAESAALPSDRSPQVLSQP